MPRFRRSLALRPIVSNKEVVDSTLLGVGAGVTSTVVLANTVNDYTGTVGTNPLGAKISHLFLFVQMISTGSGTANMDWFIMKSPNGIVPPTPGAVGGDVNRKWVLHEEKGIPGNSSDGSYPLTFKGVISIPRGRQRFGETDQIRLVLRGAVDIHNICIKAIYKVLT